MKQITYLDAVRLEIKRQGGDPSKISDSQILQLGSDRNVPAAVMQYDPEHPVFGALFDGHRLAWLVANWSTIVQIAKVAIQLFVLVAPLL